MADSTFNRLGGLTSPAWDAASVTPADGSDLSRAPTQGLWVGSSGDIALTMAGGTDVTIAGVPAGTILPLRVDRVKSTNTTASSIVALYES